MYGLVVYSVRYTGKEAMLSDKTHHLANVENTTSPSRCLEAGNVTTLEESEENNKSSFEFNS